jgi:hypothetical protein
VRTAERRQLVAAAPPKIKGLLAGFDRYSPSPPRHRHRETFFTRLLDVKLVITLYRSGLSTNKIGKRLGYHKSLVSKIVKKFGKLRFRTLSDDERGDCG